LIIRIVVYCFLILAATAPLFAAELSIPAARRTTWQGNVGVPGGIPTTWANCATDACNTLYGGDVSHTTINAAIASASNQTVVRIPAGTFTITGVITIVRSNVVLRGAGRTSTILNMQMTGQQGISTENSSSTEAALALTGGYTQGSTSITVADSSTVAAGDTIYFTQDNDFGTGTDNTDSTFMWDSAASASIVRIAANVATSSAGTITFDPPLPYALTAGLNPKLVAYTYAPMSYVGIENMTLDSAGGFAEAEIIYLHNAYASWVKNVEARNFGNACMQLSTCVRCEIRDNYIHTTYTAGDGYGIYLYKQNSGTLIENNVIDDMFFSIMGNQSVGAVIAYNYSVNIHASTWQEGINVQHGGHEMMNLYEGNVGTGMMSDGYHGSASHHTIFRNHFNGVDAGSLTLRRIMIDLCRFSHYFNVIGNVLGDSTWAATSYEMAGQNDAGSPPVIYRLGYPNMGNNGYYPANLPNVWLEGGPDANVRTTLLRHKNYDYLTASQIVCNTATYSDEGCQGATNVAVGDTIPNSLYLASKPAFFGSLTWPPVNPTGPTVAEIPAAYFYRTGSWPTDVVTYAPWRTP
jgi:hypothetical protein